MYDIFYKGSPPNRFLHEKPATSLEDAQRQCHTRFFWYLDGHNDYENFDFTWVCDKWEDHQLHVFPSQWQKDSGTYFCKRTTDLGGELQTNYRKDCGSVRRLSSHDGECWWIPVSIDHLSVNQSWHPDPSAPPYNYRFADSRGIPSGVEFRCVGAVDYKDIHPFDVVHLANDENWVIPNDVDRESIDFTWRPDPRDPPYIYRIANKYGYPSGAEYHVPGAIEYKDVRETLATHIECKDNWVIPDGLLNVDLTWRPDPRDPPYIYKFPTQWTRDSGLEYHVPGATETKYIDDISVSFGADSVPRYYIETTFEDLLEEHKGEDFWALNKEMNYDEFDFSWRPDASQLDYCHVFGSRFTTHSQTIFFPALAGIREEMLYNFVDQQSVKSNSSIDIFFIDHSNADSKRRLADLQERGLNVTKVRYVDNIQNTIVRCAKRSTVGVRFWVVSSECDYADFDFEWHAAPWQSYMLHVFASQWSKWSDTFLVNKHVFLDHAKWCKDITEFPDPDFIDIGGIVHHNTHDIYMVDMGVEHNNLQTVQHHNLKTTRFVDSYLAVIKRIVESSTSEYIWVISNACNYDNFDFDWNPDLSQREMLHVFETRNSSGCSNKFGDTFRIHVRSFLRRAKEARTLEEYGAINYCSDQSVPRIPTDIVPYLGDDLTSVIKNHKFRGPYTLFGHRKDICTSTVRDSVPKLWSQEDRALHVFTESGSTVLAPRDISQYLTTQCYDYPSISYEKHLFLPENPLNIIFISNGEPEAEELYKHLLKITLHDETLITRRVDGVKGRANAYKAAANISSTDWFFTVFGKLEVDADFDWHWQPDRLQEPKHYIFHSKNPVNGLEYGHMGMIAYNRGLVLGTDEWGLDFTLSKKHAVVPLLSGIARFNTSPIMTWRTAFRECVKLYMDRHEPESLERLMVWITDAEGENAQWSLRGANDGYQYAKECDQCGDTEAQLLKSFEWEWLDAKFEELYHFK